MEYVMVPVPEEHLDRVQMYLRWNTGGSEAGPWDRDRIAEVYRDLDDAAREILVLVARATLDGDELTADHLGSRTGLDVRSTLGTILEINDLARDDNGPPFVMLPRKEMRPDADGREQPVYVVNMSVELARLVLTAHGVDLDEL